MVVVVFVVVDISKDGNAVAMVAAMVDAVGVTVGDVATVAAVGAAIVVGAAVVVVVSSPGDAQNEKQKAAPFPSLLLLLLPQLLVGYGS